MRIGVDLGGTKIEAIVLDDADQVRARRRRATPRHDYAAIVTAIADVVLDLEARCGVRCPVGIGMPGTVSPHSGLVKNSNTTVLNGRPLDRDLEQLLARALRFENDANCFALSEATDGAGAGCDGVFGVIVGTGTGGGFVHGGRIVRGANAIGGEWGHNPLPWPTREEGDGVPCYCGRRGCIETYLCGAGLARAYGAPDVAPDGAAVAARAADGDARAVAAITRYADRMARGLASVINIVDPDVIVLGGGLSNIETLYLEVPERLPRYVFSDHAGTRIVPAVHGDASGVRGAARLWPPGTPVKPPATAR